MATAKREESEITSVGAPLSAAEAIQAAKQAQRNTTTAAQEVDERGFIFLPDKRKLVGRAFTIIDAEDLYEAIGDYWQMNVRLVLGDKPILIRDASKGIREQVLKIGVDKVKMTHWPKGLRPVDFTFEGQPRTTYYLDDTII